MLVPPPDADRPLHLRPSMLAVVAIGGALGTTARAVGSTAVQPVHGLPIAVLLINVVGAFLLGLLLEALVARAPDIGARRLVRLAAGTGFCGGFTTYSTLAVGTAELLRGGMSGIAIASALGSVLLGALAAWAGVWVGSHR